ncbi:trypsin-like serine protease [Nonomuraea jabiensis]|uniref:trypsin-like serine protease n=1 Tax=Nonomuraea jabiensis TaxID=882448 RepID=UPI00342FD230
MALTSTVPAMAAGPASAAPGNDEAPHSIEISSPVPPGFDSWQQVLAEQERLNRIADKIIAANGEGFGALTADPRDHQVRLYWKGALPEPVQAVVTQAGDAVRVLPARYTADQLHREVEHLMDSSADAGAPRLTAIGKQSDASGLRVAVEGRSPAEAGEWIRAHSQVPVSVQVNASPLPFSGRWDDTPPYWGAAEFHLENDVDDNCTTGFAIRPNTSSDQTYLLTAAHCSPGNTTVIAGDENSKRDLGVIEWNFRRANDDIELITAKASGMIYNNNGAAEFSNPVMGSIRDQVGNFVCTSGAFSGTRCGAQVTDVDLALWLRIQAWQYPVVRATSSDGKAIAGEGDSGSPVFQVNPNNTNQVYASGILTGGDPSDSDFGICEDIPHPAPNAGIWRLCSYSIYYYPMHSLWWPKKGVLKVYNASLLTP